MRWADVNGKSERHFFYLTQGKYMVTCPLGINKTQWLPWSGSETSLVGTVKPVRHLVEKSIHDSSIRRVCLQFSSTEGQRQPDIPSQWKLALFPHTVKQSIKWWFSIQCQGSESSPYDFMMPLESSQPPTLKIDKCHFQHWFHHLSCTCVKVCYPLKWNNVWEKGAGENILI
jgi:hypothetical protein